MEGGGSKYEINCEGREKKGLRSAEEKGERRDGTGCDTLVRSCSGGQYDAVRYAEEGYARTAQAGHRGRYL